MLEHHAHQIEARGSAAQQMALIETVAAEHHDPDLLQWDQIGQGLLTGTPLDYPPLLMQPDPLS